MYRRHILRFVSLAISMSAFAISVHAQGRPLSEGDHSYPLIPYDEKSYQPAQPAARGVVNNSRAATKSEVARMELLKGLRFIKNPPQYDEAEKAFQAALANDPRTFAQAYSGLGYVYFATGRYAEAEKTYKLLLASAPDSADNHFNLGLVYFYRGDVDLARQEVATLNKLKSKLAGRLEKLMAK
jgi:tetratricopeptide (TPR) repeat protein